MVLGDGVRHLLEQDGLADARRRDDEPALAKADRREKIHHAHRHLARRRLKDDAACGEGRREVLEVDDARRLAGRLAVHRHDVAKRKEAILVARVADRALHGVARAKRMAANLLEGNEHVLGTGEEVRLRAAEETVAFLDHFQTPRRHHGAAAVEVTANRPEDDLVAFHRAEILRICVRPHLCHDLAVVPRMNVLKAVLREVGVARHGGNGGRKVLRHLGRRTPIALRLHRTAVLAHALEIGTVPVALRGACEPFHATTLAVAHRLLARRGNGGLCRDWSGGSGRFSFGCNKLRLSRRSGGGDGFCCFGRNKLRLSRFGHWCRLCFGLRSRCRFLPLCAGSWLSGLRHGRGFRFRRGSASTKFGLGRTAALFLRCL